jgi:GNAT superfamily N-acetyltransferase
MAASLKIEFHPATPDRWADVEALFGARGACGGCWCQAWRKTSKEFRADTGEKNRRSLKKIIERGGEPGILAYIDGTPIGWCAVASREIYVRLLSSKVLKPLDEKPVWSVSCLFILKGYRRRGVSSKLLKAASKFVKEKGGKIVEGYPVIPHTEKMPDAFAWTGLLRCYEKAGFKIAGKWSEARPIVRKYL